MEYFDIFLMIGDCIISLMISNCKGKQKISKLLNILEGMMQVTIKYGQKLSIDSICRATPYCSSFLHLELLLVSKIPGNAQLTNIGRFKMHKPDSEVSNLVSFLP